MARFFPNYFENFAFNGLKTELESEPELNKIVTVPQH
jgi:hypothetical protein